MTAPKQTLRQRIDRADELALRYLGDANEAAEAGKTELAEGLYQKSQYWLDRFNLLTSQGERPAPRK